MPRSQKNDNFIDKTFTIVADILLRVKRNIYFEPINNIFNIYN